ncbi:hypothetical protein NQ315_013098 [Exocentrus adspersus]|uniref:Mab-21-like HhH/H2TH-like domain-containing protein n=1 Tax=Exocentrus adspersus TaxID=1586481 RepID=A0AAV8VWE6_9CUCU|nr:hypothetical protein NQ315_013098 [Exocentrus adspersus]
MGGCTSKDKSSSNVNPSRNNAGSGVNGDYNEADDIRVESINRYDEQIVSILKRDLRENPQLFLLNNMLMATQFFENYHKEVYKLANSTTSQIEKDLNRMLLKDETMECTSPDIIFDKVNKYVRFRPLHGPKKHHSEPLAAKRLFVINDTIEVINSMDLPQYTSIDKPAYQVRTEESKRKGFLRLKLIDTNKFPKQETYIEVHQESVPGPSTSFDSDIYDYMTITDLKTPKPLDIIDNPERRDTLPMTCFASRKVKKIPLELLENEDDYVDPDISEEDFFDTVTYIDSRGFMNYFKNAIFPNSLGRALGFDELAISEAKTIPGKVFCNLTDDDDNPIPCEVIPCVAIEWPDQTFEFIMREERPTITDRRTGYRYRWPTDEMLKDIRSMNCVLVPKGYWLKKGSYPDANIEWEIAFPKAERYIETRMSHTQIRVFLFLLSIHKTFIEPVSQQHGLLVEHIRCHMYWECEANYRDWPEHRLGTKLLKVITNLTTRLAKGVLPDYFIKQKNLFENIPKKYLQFAQRLFHDVIQSPAVYFMSALRNLRYTSGKFYPPLDLKELYKIVAQSQGIKIVNPNILSAVPPNLKRKRYTDADTQFKHILELKNKEKMYKKKFENNLDKMEERKGSVDSIDLKLTIEKQFDMYKIKVILQLFISQFIDIAKKSARVSTKEQTLFYLKQAWYLTNILEDTAAAFAVEVCEYRDVIAKEEEACKKMAVKEISDLPPSTPMRNSVQFDFSLQQQVKGNLVNLNNLNATFNNGIQVQPTQSFNKIKKERAKVAETNGNIPRKSVAFVETK